MDFDCLAVSAPDPCIVQGPTVLAFPSASKLSCLQAFPSAQFPLPGMHRNPLNGSNTPCGSQGNGRSQGAASPDPVRTLRPAWAVLCAHTPHAPLHDHRTHDTLWQLSTYRCELPEGKDGIQFPIAPRGPQRRLDRLLRAPNTPLLAEG